MTRRRRYSSVLATRTVRLPKYARPSPPCAVAVTVSHWSSSHVGEARACRLVTVDIPADPQAGLCK